MKTAKKICLIGRFGVGKTSLVNQFIKNQFDEKYKTTVGVSISTKEMKVKDINLSMVIWDIAGFEQDGHYKSYMRGVHGLIWVLDGTEPESYDIFEAIQQSLPDVTSIPSICFINKHDLVENWRLSDAQIHKLHKNHQHVLNSSAKTGENVESGFQSLAQSLL